LAWYARPGRWILPLSTAALESAGIHITLEQLEALVNAAIERAVPPHRASGARQALTPAELAFLDDAGVGPDELAPLDAGVRSPPLRSAAKYAAVVASGLTVQAAARRLGVSTNDVRRRLVEQTLCGTRLDRVWRLPLFQFTDDQATVVPGFASIAPALAGLHPVCVANWFTLPHVDLVTGVDDRRVSPRDWLLAGGDAQELIPLVEELHGPA
jgi:hypothetical protein